MKKNLVNLVLLFCCPFFVAFGQSSLQRSVFFDTNSALLKPEGEQSLKEVVNFLAKNPALQIELTGYTDAVGSDALNKNLATQRVQTVQNFLLRQNVPNNKIVTKAFGKVAGQAADASEETKRQSRRVDIFVTFGENMANLLSLYKKLEDPIQTFKIRTDRDTVIRGAKGTVINIPKNAFKGVPNGATVDFQLKEAYAIGDIIKENLNSMSGNRLLETGGMIYTDAKLNNQSLDLQRDLTVKFNSAESQKPEMRMFSGNRDMANNGRMNWEVVNPEDDYTSIYTSNNNIFTPYLIISEKTNTIITLPELCDTSGCFPLLLSDKNRDEFAVRGDMSNTCGALAMYLSARPQIPYRIPVDKLHKLAFQEAYTLYNVSTLSDLKAQNSTRWDSLMQVRWAYIQDREKARLENIRLQEKRKAEAQEQLEIAFEQSRIYQKHKETFERTFPISNLGWYNCDALYRGSGMVETIIVSDSLGLRKENTFADLRVIFKYRSAIIQNAQLGLRTKTSIYIPKNEAAVIVALKVEEGDALMAITECSGIQGQTLKLDFRKMTSDEIKEKLNFLNKSNGR